MLIVVGGKVFSRGGRSSCLTLPMISGYVCDCMYYMGKAIIGMAFWAAADACTVRPNIILHVSINRSIDQSIDHKAWHDTMKSVAQSFFKMPCLEKASTMAIVHIQSSHR